MAMLSGKGLFSSSAKILSRSWCFSSRVFTRSSSDMASPPICIRTVLVQRNSHRARAGCCGTCMRTPAATRLAAELTSAVGVPGRASSFNMEIRFSTGNDHFHHTIIHCNPRPVSRIGIKFSGVAPERMFGEVHQLSPGADPQSPRRTRHGPLRVYPVRLTDGVAPRGGRPPAAPRTDRRSRHRSYESPGAWKLLRFVGYIPFAPVFS